MSLLAICEERQRPAGIYLHCQVLMLDQFYQGRKCLWTKSRDEGGCGGGGEGGYGGGGVDRERMKGMGGGRKGRGKMEKWVRKRGG